MTTSLKCPTCSAPLDLPEPHARAMKCPYCGASVMLTERLGHVEAVATHERHTDAVAEVVRLLRAGRKIEAIKAYRERFGGVLQEAKDAVERIEAGQPAGSVPTSATVGARGVLGCGVAVVLLIVGAGVLASVLTMREATERIGEAVPSPSEVPGVAPPGAPGQNPGAPGEPAFAERVLQFGSEGTGAGRFTDARSVAVDGAGRVYVAEYQGGRVQVFDSVGTFLTQWMADPQMPLLDLAADRAGTVYVVQAGRIRRYEGATGEPLPELPRPSPSASYSDIALALDGSLWALAGHADLVHLSREGRVLQTLDAREVIHAEALPSRLAVAGTGDLYVADRVSGEVYRLDRDGRFVDRFGGRGDRPDQFRSPQDLAIDGRGRVYVSDLGDGIRVFDADGHYLDAFGGSAVVFGLAFNDRDELYAAFRNDHRVVKFRPPR